MIAALAFIKAWWEPIAGFLLAVLLWLGVWHYGSTRYAAGYQQAVSEDAAAVEAEKLSNQRKQDAAAALSEQTEADHATTEKTLTDRAAAAERAMANSLRTHPSCGGAPVSAVPGAPTVTPARPAISDRDQRFAAGLADVGRRCEADADELAAWQRWYSQQAALK